MGGIRVKVKLTNSYDEMRQRRGEIGADAVRSYDADAVVDTGAVRSVIPVHVMQNLGVQTRGERMAPYADGRSEAVGISEPIIFTIMTRDTPEEALVLGDEVVDRTDSPGKARPVRRLRWSAASAQPRSPGPAGVEDSVTAVL